MRVGAFILAVALVAGALLLLLAAPADAGERRMPSPAEHNSGSRRAGASRVLTKPARQSQASGSQMPTLSVESLLALNPASVLAFVLTVLVIASLSWLSRFLRVRARALSFSCTCVADDSNALSSLRLRFHILTKNHSVLVLCGRVCPHPSARWSRPPRMSPITSMRSP